MQAKHWTFTINNYTEQDLQDVRSMVKGSTYLCFGLELGAEGTPHIQGYVSFTKQLRRKQVSVQIPRAFLEVSKGTPIQNKVYCEKEGKFEEHGSIPKAQTEKATLKRKVDYEAAITLAKRQRLYEVEPSVLLRYGSSLRAIQKDHPVNPPDNDYLAGVWLYGEPGCGKSQAARWLYPGAYPKPLNKWWDGYQNEDYVILDDIEPDHKVLGHHLKQWSDHYPYTAEQKGTSIRIRPKIICITSNYSIEEIWSDWTMCQAIKRRFTIVDCNMIKK